MLRAPMPSRRPSALARLAAAAAALAAGVNAAGTLPRFRPTFSQWFARLVFQAMQATGKGYRLHSLKPSHKPRAAGTKVARMAAEGRIGKSHHGMNPAPRQVRRRVARGEGVAL